MEPTMAITTLMFVGARRVNHLRIKFQWARWNDSYPTVMVLGALPSVHCARLGLVTTEPLNNSNAQENEYREIERGVSHSSKGKYGMLEYQNK